MTNLGICHGDWSKEAQQGNLTGDAGNTYGYDVESRLKTFSKTGTTASYAYDAFNRRVSKTVNGIATFYVYDGEDIIEERNSAGTLVADYVHGDQTDEPLTMTRGTTTYYYFADGLGSIRQLTNSAGAVQQTYDYNSYGKLAAAPTVVNPYTYTGREYDVESGNYYYRARYYSPTLGRFLQRDPIGYYDSMNLLQYVDSVGKVLPNNQFMNFYAYTSNNPINRTDPLGLYWGEDQVNWWAYESVLPGPYGQPVSEWECGKPTGWGDPMRYTEEAGGGWQTAERVSVGAAAGATAIAIGAKPIKDALYILNHNRYLRIGFGQHRGKKVFRVAGEWLKRITGRSHFDIWIGGSL
ncbi:MAG: RHS repeat-associated core domain-containing protein [Candidatus Omnitrophica bacterium]|nr:RHS repeat-associated core domain-containing protein [Candidatus Omnitrophota bacterium]